MFDTSLSLHLVSGENFSLIKFYVELLICRISAFCYLDLSDGYLGRLLGPIVIASRLPPGLPKLAKWTFGLLRPPGVIVCIIVSSPGHIQGVFKIEFLLATSSLDLPLPDICLKLFAGVGLADFGPRLCLLFSIRVLLVISGVSCGTLLY